jgi:CubicO group peptidase (beta-lactamase class C family)
MISALVMRRALCGILLCAPALYSQSSAKGKGADPLAGFDAYVAKGMKDWDVPGMEIAVVKDDSVTFIKGYGVKTVGGHDSVNIHTLFANASTTKAFSSYAVMLMADSGRLSLDSRVADRLPQLQVMSPYVTSELTVRDLLTHRSGLPEAGYLWYGTNYDFNEIAKKLRLVKPTYSFREHFQYQNETYAAAGFIAAAAAKEDWEAMFKKDIFTPLGMNETVTNTAAAVAYKNVATPHFRIDDTVRAIDRYQTDNIGPAGAMYSNVADMTKWLRFLLDSARLGGKRMLSAPNFAELWKLQQIVGPDEFYPTARLTHPNYTAYGLGWFLEDYRGEAVVFHTGSIDGFVAIVGLIPSRKLGVVIFENLDHAELRHALMYTVFDRYMGGGTHDWSAEMKKMYDGARAQRAQAVAAEAKKRVMGTKPSLPLEAYAGTYRDALYGTTTIKMKDGKLWVDDPFATATVEHWNYDTFEFKYTKRWFGTQLVTFQLGTDGKVSGLDLGDGVVLARVVDSGSK